MYRLAILVLPLCLLLQPAALGLPDEAVGRVVSVVNGDSLGIEILIADGAYGGTIGVDSIKLADIATPSAITAKGKAARDYSSSLLKNKMVYLDINNNTTGKRSKWNQLICVIYLVDPEFRPVWPPVNRILVDGGFARLNDDPFNEFNSSAWWQKPPVFLPSKKRDMLNAMLEKRLEPEELFFIGPVAPADETPIKPKSNTTNGTETVSAVKVTAPSNATKATLPPVAANVAVPSTSTKVTVPPIAVKVTAPSAATKITPPSNAAKVTVPSNETKIAIPSVAAKVTVPFAAIKITPPSAAANVTALPIAARTAPASNAAKETSASSATELAPASDIAKNASTSNPSNGVHVFDNIRETSVLDAKKAASTLSATKGAAASLAVAANGTSLSTEVPVNSTSHVVMENATSPEVWINSTSLVKPGVSESGAPKKDPRSVSILEKDKKSGCISIGYRK